MKHIKKSKQNNDERLEFLSLRMIEADSLRQINFKDLIKDVANKKCRRTFVKSTLNVVFYN
jgi:phosphopantetheine adenylyltransferase